MIMEQNRLKELILSMRRSKHNMINKAADFAQAVEDKGVVDMDIHKLSGLIKDAFTRRRAKTFYADVLSGVIGEPEQSKTKDIFAAMDYNTNTQEMSPTTWSFGDAVVYSDAEISPYMVVMSPSQAQKMTHIDSNVPDEIFDDIKESIMPNTTNFVGPSEDMTVEEIMERMGCDESYARDLVENGMYQISLYQLNYIAYPGVAQGMGSDYIYITITYDGVDYKYDSDGKITITKSSNTTPVAKEAPTFVTMDYNVNNEEPSMSTYKLGDPIAIQNGIINPYIIFLTEEQKNKISISVTDAGDLSNENINDMYRIITIADEGGLSGDLSEHVEIDTNIYKYMAYGIYLPFQGNPNAEHIANKVTITYDGVDYVYQN